MIENLKKIVIVGGGSAGWMTAATLIKALPEKEIILIESKDIPTVGVGESTLAGIRRWVKYVEIDESSFFKYCDASYKLGIRFTNFYKNNGESFHYPFGQPYITDDSKFGYNDWFIKKSIYPDTPVEDFVNCLFPSSALFNSNKFSWNLYADFDNFNPDNDLAYHFDAIKFANWLREFHCIPRGVKNIQATVEDITCDENGIKKLFLDNGQQISADLFIDCTGFQSLLLGKALQEPFENYDHIIPNNRAWAAQVSYKDPINELESFTNCTALGNGWCWNTPLFSRLGTGYVYSDKYVSKEGALEEFKEYLSSKEMVVPRSRDEIEQLSFKDISMKLGIYKRTFVKNVVAIGLSAGFIEPLESNGLYSVHEFLFKLIDVITRGDTSVISELDKDMYNSQIKNQFEDFSKFVALHYALSHRTDTQYWKDAISKKYKGVNSDEFYDEHVQKNGAFYNLGQKFLREWEFPQINPGILYVSVGMNMFMLNESKIKLFEMIDPAFNAKKYADEISLMWEIRKSKWKRNAEIAPTMYEYIKEVYYG